MQSGGFVTRRNRRFLIALLAVLVLALGACASSGSSSSSSSNDGTSSNGSSSNGSSSNGSSSNGSSGNGSSGNGGTTVSTTPDRVDGATPPSTVPDGYTLPEPGADGTVEVPDGPPKEVRNASPRKRLGELPPIPTSCLDADLTLLDVFVPGAAIPVRLLYCLLYVGTIARVPADINGGSSGSGGTAAARTDTGQTLQVPLVPPNHTQRPLATLALILLIVAVSVTIGYTIGRRRGDPAQS